MRERGQRFLTLSALYGIDETQRRGDDLLIFHDSAIERDSGVIGLTPRARDYGGRHHLIFGNLTQKPNTASDFVIYRRANALVPANFALSPSSSSMARRRLYFAMRSPRQAEPVLIWPTPVATAKSAIVVSSVSPER